MTNEKLIAEIKENFELLGSRRNSEVNALLNAVNRNVMRLQTRDKQLSLQLLKIVTDLKNMLVSEADYFKLRHPNNRTNRIEYSDSFFESLDVIKKELFLLLQKI